MLLSADLLFEQAQQGIQSVRVTQLHQRPGPAVGHAAQNGDSQAAHRGRQSLQPPSGYLLYVKLLFCCK